MVVYICQTQSPYSCHPASLPTLCPQICPLLLCLCSCPGNMFICTIKKKIYYKTFSGNLFLEDVIFSMQWLVTIVASFTIKQAPCLRYRAAYQNTWEHSGSGTILHTGSKNKLLSESCSGPIADLLWKSPYWSMGSQLGGWPQRSILLRP